MGPARADAGPAFTEGFQKKNPGIRVDYNGMAGAQVAPKLLTSSRRAFIGPTWLLPARSRRSRA